MKVEGLIENSEHEGNKESQERTTLQSINNRSLKAAVIGLGYVGLPMAVEMAHAGYQVYGIDIDGAKVAKLVAGKSYVIGIEDKVVQSLTGAGLFMAGTDYAAVAHADVIVICVPTPLTAEHQPDISFIAAAVDGITPYLQKGCLVILESTTYPGTTEERVKQPIEAAKGWKAGQQFHVCYSPERVDPGSVHYGVKNTPKIIGGSTPSCLSFGKAFYGSFLNEIVPVSSTTVAETAKLFENTFRSVNIALVNELTPACEQMGVNIWEVLDAAATKPFGYMPFYPGPGIGGHCIPIDPIYLSWAAGRQGSELQFITLADATNRQMPERVVKRAAELLEQNGLSMQGSRIVLAGMAYKKISTICVNRRRWMSTDCFMKRGQMSSSPIQWCRCSARMMARLLMLNPHHPNYGPRLIWSSLQRIIPASIIRRWRIMPSSSLIHVMPLQDVSVEISWCLDSPFARM